MLETTGLTHTEEEAKNYKTNIFEENGEKFYLGCDGGRRRLGPYIKKNKKRMYVDGKYIPASHPLHKPGRYKGFEEAAFSSLQNYKSSKQGEVYIITNPAFEGWVKVGMAVDATDRLKGYQTSSPFRDYELQYFCKVNDRRASESQSHQLLATKFNQQGEWFQCSIEEARQVIDQVKLELE
jgi:hypothetical protein|tara:strand:+ start:1205 stop:1747 length:543 start_codon:yes stop_codon:yes gene_type:complete